MAYEPFAERTLNLSAWPEVVDREARLKWADGAFRELRDMREEWSGYRMVWTQGTWISVVAFKDRRPMVAVIVPPLKDTEWSAHEIIASAAFFRATAAVVFLHQGDLELAPADRT